jgi:glycosyltransferase involved in cell wall biosynthesis
MKIIYLHQYFNTPQQSGSTRSYEMARRLVAAGHEVHVVTSLRDEQAAPSKEWSRTVEAGIQVHWLPVPYSNTMSYPDRIRAFVRFAWKASARAASLGGDVVFATSTPLTIAIPGIYAARKNKIPMVFEVRDLWPDVPIAIGALRGPIAIGVARWLERLAYRNSAYVVALSPGMKAGVLRMGYPESRVRVIPNASDLDLFDVPAEAGTAFRKRFPWLGNRPLVVYTGTLGYINGVDYVARVAAATRNMDPDIRFLIVGWGKEWPKVRDTASHLGVLDQNLFMIESLPKAEIPAVLSAANLASSMFLPIPEMWANSANKFFDALAAGRPIAINHQGWQADLIQQTGAGLVLDPHDVQGAARQIVQAVRDADWLQQAGRAARRLAVERFDRDRLAVELEQVLVRAVDESVRRKQAGASAAR